MREEIALAIRNDDPEIMRIFGANFQTSQQWRAFMLRYFGMGNLPVSSILNKGVHGWHQDDFQALYVACWIYQPVEKGTYMISLTPQQRENVKSGYKKLPMRWSSHLGGSSNYSIGGSSREGWSFLSGYSELLVQLEGGHKRNSVARPYLFLKCEGHSAFSIDHIKSFSATLDKNNKSGGGLTANADLHELAEKDIGITARAAENFSVSYKKLLKSLGFDKKTKRTTIQEMTARLYARLGAPNSRYGPVISTLLQQSDMARVIAHYKHRELLNSRDSIEKTVLLFSQQNILFLLDQVFIPGIDRLYQAFLSTPGNLSSPDDVIVWALREAKPDLQRIVASLRTDIMSQSPSQTHVNYPHNSRLQPRRYFTEITVSPTNLDQAVASFNRLLTGRVYA